MLLPYFVWGPPMVLVFEASHSIDVSRILSSLMARDPRFSSSFLSWSKIQLSVLLFFHVKWRHFKYHFLLQCHGKTSSHILCTIGGYLVDIYTTGPILAGNNDNSVRAVYGRKTRWILHQPSRNGQVNIISRQKNSNTI